MENALDYLDREDSRDAMSFLNEPAQSAMSFLDEREPGPSAIKEMGGQAFETAKNVGRVYPALETAANLVTQTYGLPVSGLAGLAGLPFGKGEEWQKKVAGALIYEPQTQHGKELTGAAFYPFEELGKASQTVGDLVADKYGPTLGATAATAIQGAPLLLPFVGKAFRRKGVEGARPVEPIKGPPEGPKTTLLREQFAERFLEEPKAPVEPAIKAVDFLEAAPEIPKPKPGVTLYSGLPFKKMGRAWTKHIGEPVWDKLIMKKVPKVLEKVPGGKSVNRALLYDYRGNLKDTGKYIASLEDKQRAQAIGREYAVDLGRRLQAFPEDAQLRMGEFIRGEVKPAGLKPSELAVAKEAKLAMLDLGKQAVDAGLLSEETFFKHAGRYMPRLYTSKEYQSLLSQFKLPKPNRLDLSRFKMRKDIPPEIRKEMGEILTPGYPIAKGITQLTHDISQAKFFQGIASNPDWAIPKTIKLTKEGKPSTYRRVTYDPLTGKKIEHFGTRKEFNKPIPEGFQQLPSNKKLGVLSEAYVHPEIFRELQETVRVMETPERVWRKALGSWKFGKVIVSPKTHVRNLMSNSVLAHLGGLPMYEQPLYLTKAAKALINHDKYWKAIHQEGGATHTFVSGELRVLFDEVESQMKGIKAESLPEKLGVIGKGWAKSKQLMGKAGDLYQAEEMWFKTAKFIHNVETKKMSYKAAWKDAEKWLFDYSKITRFQKNYRSKWYGAPFATFTLKSLPRVTEAALKTPWRFAMPAGIIFGLEKASQYMIGDTGEQRRAKKKLRPDWMQGTMFGIPNFARVPFVDEYGREYYLNLTYILPWGDIAEQGKWMGIPGGVLPLSQPFVKEPLSQILNYDSFWKQPIVKERDLAGKSTMGRIATEAKARGKHLAQTMLPTPVFDVSKIVDALMNRPDYRGRFRPPAIAAADVIAGVKMYPVDYTEQVVRNLSKIDPKTGSLAREIMGQIRTYAIKEKALKEKGTKTDFYKKKIQEKIEQLRGLAAESRKKAEAYSRATKKPARKQPKRSTGNLLLDMGMNRGQE